MADNNGTKSKKKKKKATTAKTADRHVLYEHSVQSVEQETEFYDETFKKVRKRKLLHLREDFCGTALSCGKWVQGSKKRTATGVDLDSSVLDWGKRNNIDPIGDAAGRVTLLQQDVRTVSTTKFDAVCAMNFSYFIFKKRSELREYFETVHRSLVDDGVFFLDLYGGYEAQQVVKEKRKVKDFTYVWHQAKYNPIDSTGVNYIHFEFKDGTKLAKAFKYDWRIYQPIEVREALLDAGFQGVETYWEDEDEDGEGNGNYRPRKRVENQAGWIAYLVATK